MYGIVASGQTRNLRFSCIDHSIEVSTKSEVSSQSIVHFQHAMSGDNRLTIGDLHGAAVWYPSLFLWPRPGASETK